MELDHLENSNDSISETGRFTFRVWDDRSGHPRSRLWRFCNGLATCRPVGAPGRRILAYASAVLMLLAGAGLLYTPTVKWSIRILFPYLLAWQLLKVPALWVAPGMEAVWLGFGEIAVPFSGGWVLFALLSQLDSESRLLLLTGQRGVRVARTLFAVSLVPIGLSHLFYVKLTVH